MRAPRSLVVVAALVMLLAASAACGDDGGAASGTDVTTTTGLQGAVRDPLPDVSAVTLPEVTDNREPTPFTMRAQPDHLLVVYFGYTHCPDVCPTSLSALRKAYKNLGDLADRVDTAMATVDPAADTPTVLSDYLGSFFSRFHALRTTDTTALHDAEEPFAATSAITPQDDGTYTVSHTGSTYVVDETGTVVVEWPFGTSAAVITADLRVLFARLA